MPSEKDKPKGMSKYGKKVQRRKRLARTLGVSPDTPYPVLRQIQSSQDEDGKQESEN